MYALLGHPCEVSTPGCCGLSRSPSSRFPQMFTLSCWACVLFITATHPWWNQARYKESNGNAPSSPCSSLWVLSLSSHEPQGLGRPGQFFANDASRAASFPGTGGPGRSAPSGVCGCRKERPGYQGINCLWEKEGQLHPAHLARSWGEDSGRDPDWHP